MSGNYAVVASPVGGYWVVSHTRQGEAVFQQSTRKLESAIAVMELLHKVDEVLLDDSRTLDKQGK